MSVRIINGHPQAPKPPVIQSHYLPHLKALPFAIGSTIEIGYGIIIEVAIF